MPDVMGFLERRRAAWPWLDHIIRAWGRYQSQKGDYFAAGITYFSVFALFPLLMVAFAIGGFVLVNNPELIDSIHSAVLKAMPGDFGNQINELIDSAIAARATVGVIGLVAAAYSGLGWMANVREALTAMWEQKHPPSGFVATKLRDLSKLAALFVAVVASIGLSVLAESGVIERVLRFFGIEDLGWVQTLIQIGLSVLSLVVTWALLTWVIARLPREPVTLRSAARAALIAAIGFEVFKRVGVVYLQSVTGGPAGATFGPIIGLLVLIYFTARLILYATAWAATSHENEARAFVPPPEPAVIAVAAPPPARSATVGEAAVLIGTGAAAVLGLQGLVRRRRARE